MNSEAFVEAEIARYRTAESLKSKRYRERHLRQSREYASRWKKSHPIEARLQVNARRAKTKGRVVKEDIANWVTRICGICDRFIEGDFHLDHIMPLSRGGEHTAENLQLAHPRCNQVKHNNLPTQPLVV